MALFAGEDTQAAAARIGARPGVVIRDVQPRPDGGLLELELPATDFAGLATLSEVQFVEEASEATYRNDSNKWIVQSNVSGSTPVWSHGLHGENQVGGHIDGGVRQTHCSFSDPGGNPIGPAHRKILAYNGSTTADTHGTHTAGTFLGDEFPVNGTTTFRGMAYLAKMAFTNLGSVTSANLLATLNQDHNANGGNGARVHSNSWGDDSTVSYNSWARDVDQFSFTHEDDLVLFAVTDLNSAVKTPENAKDCLAVTLSSDTPSQTGQCANVGFGNTQDGRRKPEVAAPGCSTTSCNSGTTCGFTSSGFTGTSMACPAVAGAGLLVRQYFTDGFCPTGAAVPANAVVPSGALLKAMLINSAADMTGISGFPSTREGWGRVLLDDALYFTGDARKLIVLHDRRNASGLTTGGSAAYNFTINSASQPLKITLVWTEAPAALNANPAYINNLNLSVTAGGSTYLGNVFSGGQSTTGGSADAVNNVEQVLRTSPPAGPCTATVNAVVVNAVNGPQGYALVVTGDVSLVIPAPGISSITPNTGLSGGVVNITNLAGSNFQSGATVRLDPNGDGSTINATGVNVVNANQITCSFNLAGAYAGTYDVVVTNPDTQSATLAAGFSVTVNCLPGDVNNDGLINGDDAQSFVNVLLTGGGTPQQFCAVDMTLDLLRTPADIDAFVACLMSAACSP
ncbi:MAG: S8 family serine peptidase [Phycisphaerae bacterium]